MLEEQILHENKELMGSIKSKAQRTPQSNGDNSIDLLEREVFGDEETKIQ